MHFRLLLLLISLWGASPAILAQDRGATQPDAVWDAVVGHWRGQLVRPQDRTAVELSIQRVEAGSVKIVALYPDLRCQAEVSVRAATAQSIKLTQTLTEPAARCNLARDITLIPAGGALMMVAANPLAQGTLVKTPPSRAMTAILGGASAEAALALAEPSPPSQPTLMPSGDNGHAEQCIDRNVVASFYRIIDRVDKHPGMVAARRAMAAQSDEIPRFTMIAAVGADSKSKIFKCIAFEVRVDPAPFDDTFELAAKDQRGATFTSRFVAAKLGMKGSELIGYLGQVGNWVAMQDFFLEQAGGGKVRVFARYRIIGNEEFSETVSLQVR